MQKIKISNKKPIHILLLTITILFIAFSLQATFAVDQTVNQTHPDPLANVQSNIKDAITNADPGDTITITPDTYKGNQNTNLNIDKNLTIKGNGPTNTVIIDAEKNNRIFTIADNTNVTFINLTFLNGQPMFNIGGAILNQYNNSVMTFINCSFINNTALSGGAISNNGAMNITDCDFTNNAAILFGGAIDNGGVKKSYVSNSNFTNNTVSDFSGEGGAIRNGADMTVTGSNFINNSVEYRGGAIYNFNRGNMTVIESNFINNRVLFGSGGAIHNRGANIFISYSNFTNNFAYLNGGAIFNQAQLRDGGLEDFSANLSVYGSNFINNTAGIDGGAISNYGQNSFYVSTGGVVRTDAIIQYNRFLNNNDSNGFTITNKSAPDSNTIDTINADYNWWGNNAPTGLTNFGIANWFVIQLSAKNLTDLFSTIVNATSEINGTVDLSYGLALFNNATQNTTIVPTDKLAIFDVNVTWTLNGIFNDTVINLAKNIYDRTFSGFYVANIRAIADYGDVNLTVYGGYDIVDPVANLTITKSANATTLINGEYVTYTIVVKNNGPDTAVNVKVTEKLPSTLLYLNNTPSIGTTYNPATGLWTIGDLANGTTVTLLLFVKTNGTGLITNHVSLTTDTPNKGNNNSEATITVNNPSKPKWPTITRIVVVGDRITATLTNSSGVPLVGKEVVFRIKGVIIGVGITDSNGVVTIYYKGADKHIITASFAGDDGYYESDTIFNPKTPVDPENPVSPNNPTSPGNIPSVSTVTANIQATASGSNLLDGTTTMKKTGLPIVAVLLVLLTSIPFIRYRKKE